MRRDSWPRSRFPTRPTATVPRQTRAAFQGQRTPQVLRDGPQQLRAQAEIVRTLGVIVGSGRLSPRACTDDLKSEVSNRTQSLIAAERLVGLARVTHWKEEPTKGRPGRTRKRSTAGSLASHDVGVRSASRSSMTGHERTSRSPAQLVMLRFACCACWSRRCSCCQAVDDARHSPPCSCENRIEGGPVNNGNGLRWEVLQGLRYSNAVRDNR